MQIPSLNFFNRKLAEPFVALGMIRNYWINAGNHKVAARYLGDAPTDFAKIEDAKILPRDETSPFDPLGLDLWEISARATDSCAARSKVLEGLLYSPEGIAWHKWKIEASASTRDPATIKRIIKSLPYRVPRVVEEGAVLEARWSHTFGDWFGECLKSIVLTNDFLEPLILPRHFSSRSYVHRDLKRLGIEHEFAFTPHFIKRCQVLKLTQPGLIWTRDEVRDFRRKSGAVELDAAPGSAVYLSREGVESELPAAVSRKTRSEIVNQVMAGSGGHVLRTQSMSHDDFILQRANADIVVADHGAAMFNMVYWRPRIVIEIASPDWWDPCFVFLSAALGTKQHIVLNAAKYDDPAFQAVLTDAIAWARRLPSTGLT